MAVTYAADAGQRYTIVSHTHRTEKINNIASVCYMGLLLIGFQHSTELHYVQGSSVEKIMAKRTNFL